MTAESLSLQQQILGHLTRDPRVNLEQSTLTVHSTEGIVTLEGMVPSVAAKRLAILLAAEVEGVRQVIDHLRVTPPNPMGDIELADHVRRAFIEERNIEEQRISISATPLGEIVLTGTVHSLVQRRLCEVLCWWIPGVSTVENRIEVVPFEADNDEELRDNLLTILEKDVLVNPSKFRLQVREGNVLLTGRVDSPTEKDAAEQDCWYTPGVRNVENGLRIG